MEKQKAKVVPHVDNLVKKKEFWFNNAKSSEFYPLSPLPTSPSPQEIAKCLQDKFGNLLLLLLFLVLVFYL